jgi:adenylate cyclase class IV
LKGKFLSEHSFVDTYYDTDDASYTRKKAWLRKRQEVFELKIARGQSTMDSYEEIRDIAHICHFFSIEECESRDLEQTLLTRGIIPFCTFVTTRRKYLFNGCIIDIDCADFGDLSYQVAELECCVENEEQLPFAEQKISSILQLLNVNAEITVPAKLTYFLYHRRFDHYKTLVASGAIQPMHEEAIPLCK